MILLPMLVEVIRNPELVRSFSNSDWDLLVRQSRKANLLATLYELFSQSSLFPLIPEKPARHFSSGKVMSARQLKSVEWEVNRISEAVSVSEVPAIVLKGGAYVICDLPASNGRLFSDIDLLVPRADLAKVERALLLAGWVHQKSDAYDDRYYREWMHELPPFIHINRSSIVDLHHNILPDTAKLKPGAAKLIESARKVQGFKNISVLAPIDMILHSATHLFHEGELEHGLRDLVDLDSLFRHFGETEENFWQELVPRAKELDLILPLYYAIHYTTRILGTPIPEDVISAAKAGAPRFPKLMDFLFDRALMPDHPSCDDRFTGFARWALYVRSHYLRMPFHLLIPHLVRKAWKRRFDQAKDEG